MTIFICNKNSKTQELNNFFKKKLWFGVLSRGSSMVEAGSEAGLGLSEGHLRGLEKAVLARASQAFPGDSHVPAAWLPL